METDVTPLPPVPSGVAVDLESDLARLALIRLGAPFGAVLREIAQVAAEVIPAADDVCVAVLDRARAVGVEFASRRLAAALDERLHPVGYGPGFRSAHTGRAVLIRDTGRADDHRDFARLAHDRGVGHVLAVPLPLSGSPAAAHDVVGALIVYSAAAPADDAAAYETARRFAEAAAVTVGNAVLYVAVSLQAAQLQEAMASRAVIEQAKGVIMATEKCTPESAFDRLRDASMHSHRKLRDIAASIVAGASA